MKMIIKFLGLKNNKKKPAIDSIWSSKANINVFRWLFELNYELVHLSNYYCDQERISAEN